MKAGLGRGRTQAIFEDVMNDGTCQNVDDVPHAVRDAFVVSADITRRRARAHAGRDSGLCG